MNSYTPRTKKYSEELKRQVLDYKKDHTISETCKKFGVSKYSINKWGGWVRKNQKLTNKRWYENNGKEYYAEPENRLRHNEQVARFRRNNPEKDGLYCKKGRDRHRFQKLAEYANRNFFRKNKKGYHLLTAFELWKIAKKQRLICPFTGHKLTKENMSVDHIVPISKGGSNAPSNVRLIHKWINLMIGVHSDEDFFKMCRTVLDFQEKKNQVSPCVSPPNC